MHSQDPRDQWATPRYGQLAEELRALVRDVSDVVTQQPLASRLHQSQHEIDSDLEAREGTIQSLTLQCSQAQIGTNDPCASVLLRELDAALARARLEVNLLQGADTAVGLVLDQVAGDFMAMSASILGNSSAGVGRSELDVLSRRIDKAVSAVGWVVRKLSEGSVFVTRNQVSYAVRLRERIASFANAIFAKAEADQTPATLEATTVLDQALAALACANPEPSPQASRVEEHFQWEGDFLRCHAFSEPPADFVLRLEEGFEAILRFAAAAERDIGPYTAGFYRDNPDVLPAFSTSRLATASEKVAWVRNLASYVHAESGATHQEDGSDFSTSQIVFEPYFTDLLTREAVFLPTTGDSASQVALSRTMLAALSPESAEWRVRTAFVFAHELGHRYQNQKAKSAVPIDLRGILNPIGLEAWALKSEAIVPELEPWATWYYVYRQFRRLFPLLAKVLHARSPGSLSKCAAAAARSVPLFLESAKKSRTSPVYGASVVEVSEVFGLGTGGRVHDWNRFATMPCFRPSHVQSLGRNRCGY